MEPVKGATQSVTIWAAVVVILAQIAQLAGYTITADDQQALVNLLQSGALAVTSVVSLVGGVAAIYGRVRASRRVVGVAPRRGARALMPRRSNF